MITLEQFKECLSKCKTPEVWHPLIEEELPKFGITNNERLAAFLAQTGHESAEYNSLEENLNYSRDALLRVFPSRFGEDNVDRYARKPQLIANRVYSNRMGNGNESSEDGWKYKGRGLIQCTGKNNYKACSLRIFGDERLLDTPELLVEPQYALLSALWFWDANDLNSALDFVTLTKRINGGTNGLAHRRELYNKALSVLNENV